MRQRWVYLISACSIVVIVLNMVAVAGAMIHKSGSVPFQNDIITPQIANEDIMALQDYPIATSTTVPTPSPTPKHEHHSGGGTYIFGSIAVTVTPTPNPTMDAMPSPVLDSMVCTSCANCVMTENGYECPPDNNDDPTTPYIEPCQPFPACMGTTPPDYGNGTDINEPPPCP